MKENPLKKETIVFPELRRLSSWDELFRTMRPRLGDNPQDVVRLEITATNLIITRLKKDD